MLAGCSSFGKKAIDYSSVGEIQDKDYVEHLSSIGAKYLAHEETVEIKLSKESIQFLEQMHERIVTNNEMLMKHAFLPTFHVIANKTPFVFSLPHSQYYISSGLVEKYLKSEELFVAALTPEILKSDRNIYEKRIMIPFGFYNTEKLTQITKSKPAIKFQINEWVYIILKRAGYDPTAYLNWIQVQNRNTLDFSLYMSDAVSISKEEQYFKNYMTKQGVSGVDKKPNEANSSKSFYKLINNIAGKR